jgi:phosphopantothenoylcysteine decarboxylase/phosphopantothenate--cysteine ligase
MTTTDLHVEPVSGALAGKTVELIVTGSIGAIESVRFARSLRRLGAEVRVTMSKGATQFVTPLALEWASANSVQTDFSGMASHVAQGDVCVIAPSSANFLHKLAAGITDTPCAALATSYCGTDKPVLILPNMHSSLSEAPAVKENLARVAGWGVIVSTRDDEHKKKFPEPAALADFVAHHTNLKQKRVLNVFGGTKAYLDDVRYLGNYSSGALGSLTTEELYRRGYEVDAVVGSAEVLPNSFSTLTRIQTNSELESTCTQLIGKADALIFAAAVLDYIPAHRSSGKIRSGKTSMQIELVPTKKIIADLTPKTGVKIGFKLEVDQPSPKAAAQLAQDYIKKYRLSRVVINVLADISMHNHAAYVFDRSSGNNAMQQIVGKRDLAFSIAQHIEDELR